jgi:hypothetical protein
MQEHVHARKRVKISLEVSRGDLLRCVVVEWLAHHLQVSPSVTNLALLRYTLLIITEM